MEILDVVGPALALHHFSQDDLQSFKKRDVDMQSTGVFSQLRAKLRDWAVRVEGLAATLGQHSPLLTQRL